MGLAVTLGNILDPPIFGVLQHVRTCTPRFYISRTAEPIALIFGM